MTPKDTPPEVEIIKKKTEPDPEPAGVHKHDEHRKQGYRGYPNNPDLGGDIHMGTGFAGVGPTGGAGSSGSSIISEKTRESCRSSEEEGRVAPSRRLRAISTRGALPSARGATRPPTRPPTANPQPEGTPRRAAVTQAPGSRERRAKHGVHSLPTKEGGGSRRGSPQRSRSSATREERRVTSPPGSSPRRSRR